MRKYEFQFKECDFPNSFGDFTGILKEKEGSISKCVVTIFIEKLNTANCINSKCELAKDQALAKSISSAIESKKDMDCDRVRLNIDFGGAQFDAPICFDCVEEWLGENIVKEIETEYRLLRS